MAFVVVVVVDSVRSGSVEVIVAGDGRVGARLF